MPRIFTKDQREQINSTILSTAREEFARHGFTKTSISHIAKTAGIGTGTFYNFYSSKEELFFTILGSFDEEKRRQIKLCFTDHGDPIEELSSFLERMFQYAASDPLLQWFSQEKVYNRIVAKVSQEILEKHLRDDITTISRILESTQPRGYLVGMKAEDLTIQLRALFMVSLSMYTIGVTDTERFMKQQIAILVNGLALLYSDTI